MTLSRGTTHLDSMIVPPLILFISRCGRSAWPQRMTATADRCHPPPSRQMSAHCSGDRYSCHFPNPVRALISAGQQRALPGILRSMKQIERSSYLAPVCALLALHVATRVAFLYRREGEGVLGGGCRCEGEKCEKCEANDDETGRVLHSTSLVLCPTRGAGRAFVYWLVTLRACCCSSCFGGILLPCRAARL